jgi:lipopolysaccharide transport system permease protein
MRRGKELKTKRMKSHFTAPFRFVPTLAQHRFLLGQLAWRAFASRYAGSYLGWLWTPLSTLIQFALFMAVFSVILEIKIAGLGIDLARRPAVGFGLYLITGLVPFLALNDAVLRAARVFRSHASLVQRVRMPAEVLVLGDVLGALLHHAISFVVVLVICMWRGHTGIANLPWLGLAVLLFVVWVVGLSLTASVLGAALPDVPEGLALIMQVVFYGAPIVYPLAMVSDQLLRNLITANPVTTLVDVARSGLISSAPPSAAAIVYVLVAGFALVLVGTVALDRWRFAIADLV